MAQKCIRNDVKYPEYLACVFVVVHDIIQMRCGSVCNVTFINLAMLNEWSKFGSHRTKMSMYYKTNTYTKIWSQISFPVELFCADFVFHCYSKQLHTHVISMYYCFRRWIIYTTHPMTNTKKTTRRRQTPDPLEFGS